MSKDNFQHTVKIHGGGTEKLNEHFIDMINERIGHSLSTIRGLTDIDRRVAQPITAEIYEGAEQELPIYQKLLNFKVIANESIPGNEDHVEFPYFLQLTYRHKDSVAPTIITWRFDPPDPEPEEVDKFMAWRKPESKKKSGS
jgi:hypothetical protein